MNSSGRSGGEAHAVLCTARDFAGDSVLDGDLARLLSGAIYDLVPTSATLPAASPRSRPRFFALMVDELLRCLAGHTPRHQLTPATAEARGLAAPSYDEQRGRQR